MLPVGLIVRVSDRCPPRVGLTVTWKLVDCPAASPLNAATPVFVKPEVEVIAKPPDKRSARPEAMFEIENVSVWGEITVPKSRVYTPLEPVNVPPPPVCESLATA